MNSKDHAAAKNIAFYGAVSLGSLLLTFYAVVVLITSSSTNVVLSYAAFVFFISAVWFAYVFLVQLLLHIKKN